MKSSASRTQRTIVNAASAAVSHVGQSLIGLLMTPFVVAGIGIEAYGLWAFAMSARYLLSLTDMGLGFSFFKFVPAYAAKGEQHRVRQVVTFGILFYFVLGAICTPIVMLLAPYLVSGLKLNGALRGQAPFFLTAFVAYFFAFMMGRTLAWCLTAVGELKISALYDAIGQIIFSVLAVAAARIGFGVDGLLAAGVVQLIVTTAIMYVAVRRRLGPILTLKFEREVIVALFRLGGWLQLGSLASVLNGESDQLVIAFIFGTEWVGFYEIGAKIARAIKAQAWYFFNAFTPAVSALHAENGESRINAAFLRANRYVAIVSFGTVAFAAAYSGYIISAWMGPAYATNAMILSTILLLGTSYAIDIVSAGGGAAILNVTDKAQYVAYNACLMLPVHFAVAFIAAHFLGPAGVVTGAAVASVIGSVYFTSIFYPLRKIDPLATLVPLAGKLIIAVVLSAMIALIFTDIIPPISQPRLSALVHIICGGIAYSLMTLILLRALGVIEASDVSLMRSFVPKRFRLAENA